MGGFSGNGRLISDGHDLGVVTYELPDTAFGLTGSAQGEVRGDPAILERACRCSVLSLVLDSGKAVRLDSIAYKGGDSALIRLAPQ